MGAAAGGEQRSGASVGRRKASGEAAWGDARADPPSAAPALELKARMAASRASVRGALQARLLPRDLASPRADECASTGQRRASGGGGDGGRGGGSGRSATAEQRLIAARHACALGNSLSEATTATTSTPPSDTGEAAVADAVANGHVACCGGSSGSCNAMPSVGKFVPSSTLEELHRMLVATNARLDAIDAKLATVHGHHHKKRNMLARERTRDLARERTRERRNSGEQWEAAATASVGGGGPGVLRVGGELVSADTASSESNGPSVERPPRARGTPPSPPPPPPPTQQPVSGQMEA